MFPEGGGVPKDPKVAEVPLDPLPQPTGTTGIHRELPGRITVPRNPVLVDVPRDGGSRLANSLGPIISELYRVDDCPYPDPLARVLGYRVADAPDGTPVQTIEIFRVAGTASERVFISPVAGSSAAPETVRNNIVDPAASEDVTAYVLVATDGKGRTVSRRVNVHYANPDPTFEVVRMNMYPDSRRQQFIFKLGNLALGAGQKTARITVINSRGQTVHSQVNDFVPIDGISGYPTEFFTTVSDYTFNLYLDSGIQFLRNGHVVVNDQDHPEFRVKFDFNLVRPARCSFGQRTISYEYHSRAVPAPVEPEPETTEPADTNDGYRYRISCDCTYDPRPGDADPSTYEAPDFENETVQIQSCLSNERGVQWPCNSLPGRRRWASTTCIASSWEQLDEEPTCHAIAIP